MDYQNDYLQAIDKITDLQADNEKLREQIKEMQLLSDKANAQLQKGNIPNVSGKWVSVSERLPDVKGRYLVHREADNVMCFDMWLGSDWRDLHRDRKIKITSWMQYPEKPIAEIKPINTVKAIKIEISTSGIWCNDACKIKGIPRGTSIGSVACQECRHYNRKLSDVFKDLVVCSQYTEELAKKQKLKYSIV